MQKVRHKNRNAFTLVELLVALMVTSIVFTAVATLAYALGGVNETSSDKAEKQAQLRYATLRISELIRHSKLVCGTAEGDLAIWRADDNDNGEINPSELVYLEPGASRDYLRLLDFPSAADWLGPLKLKLSDIRYGTTKSDLILLCDIFLCDERRVVLVPECSNVQFLGDLTPQSKFVSISFELVENDIVRQYQINAALRGWAGHLLDSAGDSLVTGDDD